MSIHDETKEIQRKLDEAGKTTVLVALFGQPGAGKSTLINKIVGEKVAEVGVETDKTVELSWYEAKGLRFADLPGYGTERFPKGSYFQRFDMMQFDLFLCVTSGKFHQADTEFFQELKKRGKVCIFIVNKHDELWEDEVPIEELEQRKLNDIAKQVGQSVKVIFTSCKVNTGLDKLNEEISNNLEAAKRERWVRGAKAYSEKFLQEKRASCEKYVALAAAASALNGINPIPGADITVDISILLKLFKEIRDDYGLTETFLDDLKDSSIPAVGLLANNVVKYAVQEGIVLLLQRFIAQETIKSITKYIPFVGQAIAASIGYAITSNAGNSYLNDCHELAEQILKHNLGV
ncbi:MAG: GTPase [Neobacillus sp.]